MDDEVAPALACEPPELDVELVPDDLESPAVAFLSEEEDEEDDTESLDDAESFELDSEGLADSEPLVDSEADSFSLRLPEADEPWSFL